MAKKYKGKNLNYNFADQKGPKRMGEGDFANMPERAKFLKFKRNEQDQAMNTQNILCDIEEVSGIFENIRSD
jgi:hypothetical protein